VVKPDQSEEQYRLLMNALGESILEMSDEDVEAEFGSAPLPRILEIFRAAAKDYSQEKLRAARAQYKEASSAIQAHSFELPPSATERRALLGALLASQLTQGLGTLTAQFRKLTAVSDADVESTLKQLEALGVFRKFREQNSG
jgi:hypothetical protein